MNVLGEVSLRRTVESEKPVVQEETPGDVLRKKTFRRFGDAMLIEIAAIFSYALYAGGLGGFLELTSVAVMLAGASTFVAAALGFLFGLPHTVQGTGAELAQKNTTVTVQAKQAARHEARSDEADIGYRMNTNLEQISDWFTKILVGVGLTQLGSIGDAFTRITGFAAEGLGGAHSQVFVAALLIYSAVIGFLFGFLWTRLVMHRLLHVADADVFAAVRTKFEENVKKLEESAKSTEERLQQSQEQKLGELQKTVQAQLQDQMTRDTQAMHLALRQLSPNEPGVSQEELDKALAAATPKARNEIFFYVSPVVQQNKPENKTELERALPVVRSLVNADNESLDHPSHNLLAMALSHKDKPDFAEAEKEFAVAIDIQNRLKEGKTHYSEYGLVLAMIAQEAGEERERSSPLRKAQIIDALRTVYHGNTGLGDQLVSLGPVRDWMNANGVEKDVLRSEPVAQA